jgi:3-deoxy-7-phosphoheptulonate synthase
MSGAATSPALVVLLNAGTSAHERSEAAERIGAESPGTAVCHGTGWTALSVAAGAAPDTVDAWRRMPAVAQVTPISAPYRLASKDGFDADRSVALTRPGAPVVEVGGTAPILIIAAPIERDRAEYRPEALVAAARAAGATVIHAGELASATNPNTRRVGLNDLSALSVVARSEGLGISVEVSDARQIAEAAGIADLLQVGARNMQNFGLLRELGSVRNAVLLRRCVGATLEEFLLAAEYVLAGGNGKVILCESSLTSTGPSARPRFEINAIPVLKGVTHLPVVADPTHSTVLGHLVPAVARAAVAAGADGLCLEISETGSTEDIDPGACRRLLDDVETVAKVLGRGVDPRSRRPVTTPSLVRREDEGARSAPAVREAADVLRMTDATLQSTIASLLGARPELDVVGQMRMTPPYPAWLRWVLHAEGDLLARWTRYRIGDVILSRHVAYVDFGRVDPETLERLQAEEIHLAHVLSDRKVDKFGFEFGNGGSAGELDLALRRGHSDVRNLNPYHWRRYIAATSGRVGFLVVEALPSLLWRRLLGSDEERLRLTA